MNVDSLIQNDWAREPSMMKACLNIWHALLSRESQSDHYTFPQLAEMAKTDDESLLSRASLYLATPKIQALKTCLMYEFNGGYFELPEEEVVSYSKGQGAVHPDLGVPLSDSDILVCFVPGSLLSGRGAQ